MMPSQRAYGRAKGYEIITVSIYAEDLREIDRKIAEAQVRGVKRPTRSRFIRAAIARLGVEEFAASRVR